MACQFQEMPYSLGTYVLFTYVNLIYVLYGVFVAIDDIRFDYVCGGFYKFKT